jgi:hypothetical protein
MHEEFSLGMAAIGRKILKYVAQFASAVDQNLLKRRMGTAAGAP